MNKQAFLSHLRKGLSKLPQAEIEERLTFYSEMIDDRIEEGLSEEEAVSAVGSVDEIIANTITDIPPTRNANKQSSPKRNFKAWTIILLALGSPIWFSLLIAALAVIVSLYVSLWSVIISLWAVFGAMIACSFVGIATGSVFTLSGNVLQGIAMLALALICIGLSIFMFYGCKLAVTGTCKLTKKFALWLRFIKKEEAQ